MQGNEIEKRKKLKTKITKQVIDVLHKVLIVNTHVF